MTDGIDVMTTEDLNEDWLKYILDKSGKPYRDSELKIHATLANKRRSIIEKLDTLINEFGVVDASTR